MSLSKKVEFRNSSSEYLDIHAFLSATRGCFEAFEIYPESFAGLYGVVRDRIIQAKEGLNIIATSTHKIIQRESLVLLPPELKNWRALYLS